MNVGDDMDNYSMHHTWLFVLDRRDDWREYVSNNNEMEQSTG